MGFFDKLKSGLGKTREAFSDKVNNVFRVRIIIKCQVTRRMRELICRLLSDFPKASAKAAISVDVNPASL